jgi:uncharacterized protein YciW
MIRLINDENKAQQIKQELRSKQFQILDDQQVVALKYTKMLTSNPADLQADDINKMRSAGWDDGQILEINQVAAYFNYANRTVLGLGVHLEGDILGLSPNNSDDLKDWSHK